MKAVLGALFGAGLTAAACYAVGALFIDRIKAPLRMEERFPLALTLGAACLHLAIFAILALQIAYWPVLVALLLAILLWAYRTGALRMRGLESQRLPRPLLWFIGVPGTLFSLVYLINALAPESSPDGAGYHLGVVARYLRAHGLEKVTTNFYAMLSEGVEMLFVPAFAIGRHSSAALLQFIFAIGLALALLAYGRRLGKPWVGATAALLTFLSPVFGLTASMAYVDVATGAIVFSAFYWVEVWDDFRDWRLLIPAGLLAGYAYAAKYTAFSIAIYVIGFVLWRSRRLKPALIVIACAAVTAGPWLARNWIFYQNPLAPFANALFRNPYVHVHFEQDYAAYFRHYEVTNLWTLPLEATVGGAKAPGLLGPGFLLLPLGLLALRYSAGRRLWLAGLLAFVPYFGNVSARFLIPALPFFSLIIALALPRWPVAFAAVMVFHSFTSWYQAIPRYADKQAWRIATVPWRAALRLADTDQYLRTANSGYGPARMIEAHVPEDEPVLAIGSVADSYTRREVMVSFQSAGNEVLTDIFNMGANPDFQPSRALILHFAEKRTHRIRVRQIANAAYPEHWNVHEMRFYSGGVEIPRRLEWSLRAWPMPGDVQMAFDNLPATRWRSWETASPGMYLDVDFGREESVDEVRIETSPEYGTTRLVAEFMDTSGNWQKAGEVTKEAILPPNPQARRMATYALHSRGVHYLMLYDTSYGADDIRADPEAWGLKLVAAEPPARLYRTTW